MPLISPIFSLCLIHMKTISSANIFALYALFFQIAHSCHHAIFPFTELRVFLMNAYSFCGTWVYWTFQHWQSDFFFRILKWAAFPCTMFEKQFILKWSCVTRFFLLVPFFVRCLCFFYILLSLGVINLTGSDNLTLFQSFSDVKKIEWLMNLGQRLNDAAKALMTISGNLLCEIFTQF